MEYFQLISHLVHRSYIMSVLFMNNTHSSLGYFRGVFFSVFFYVSFDVIACHYLGRQDFKNITDCIFVYILGVCSRFYCC